MSFHSEAEIRNTMDACFDGYRTRNCESCPANNLRGGPCCFGSPNEYEEDSDQCKECNHHQECREEVFDRVAVIQGQSSNSTTSRYTSNRFGRPTYSRTVHVNNRTTGNQRVVQIGQKPKVGGVNVKANEPLFTPKAPPAPYQHTRTKSEDPKDKGEEGQSKAYRMFMKFIRHCLWGAGEGLSTMAADFFRVNRPDSRWDPNKD